MALSLSVVRDLVKASPSRKTSPQGPPAPQGRSTAPGSNHSWRASTWRSISLEDALAEPPKDQLFPLSGLSVTRKRARQGVQQTPGKRPSLDVSPMASHRSVEPSIASCLPCSLAPPRAQPRQAVFRMRASSAQGSMPPLRRAPQSTATLPILKIAGDPPSLCRAHQTDPPYPLLGRPSAGNRLSVSTSILHVCRIPIMLIIGSPCTDARMRMRACVPFVARTTFR
jgi:hypothetical protein